MFLHERDFSEYLGGVERDANGKIIKAKATFIRWFGKSNTTEVKRMERDKTEDLGMSQQPVSYGVKSFEKSRRLSLSSICLGKSTRGQKQDETEDL